MERECFLSILVALLGGTMILACGWWLVRDEGEVVTATVGLLRPWVLFSPYLAKTLDERTIEAALAHERAHARHRDPLRIWLAQLATDLQWAWPQAHKRFRLWIVALELARDEEARASGVDGSDLATAVLASARLSRQAILPANAALISDPSTFRERISRLLEPLPLEQSPTHTMTWTAVVVIPILLGTIGLGSVFGEQIVRTLL